VIGDPAWEVDEFPAGIVRNFTVGSRIAGYRLEEMIGRGGMALVFRAVDERLDRQVALKILAPSLAQDQAFRQRFVGESRRSAAVDDPHIIPVHEAGEADGVLFIAMRYVPGGDVRTLVHQTGPLTATRAAAIVSPVASALDAAHGAGLVHRDIKPANMLLDTRAGRPDHVYLSDFGLSKESVAPKGLTLTGQFLGTPAYSSPEQIEGKPLDGRADQYSLACATFELLTGAPPFVQDQVTALILAHMSAPPPSLTSRRPDLPDAADQVFAKALAKKREDRYVSCRDFADDLRRAFGMLPYDSGPDTIPPPTHPPNEVASQGGGRTPEVQVPRRRAGDTPTNVIIDRDRTGGGQDTTDQQSGTDRRPTIAQDVALTPQPVRLRATRTASCLVLLAALAAIGSYIFPGPFSPHYLVPMVPYLAAVVVAVVVLLRGEGKVVPTAILLGLWAPAIAFLAVDFVAIAAEHSLGYTGGGLVGYDVGVSSDLLGTIAVLVLWTVWRSSANAIRPAARRGRAMILVCVVGFATVMQLIQFATFDGYPFVTAKAYDYTEGVAVLVVGLAVAWTATGVSDRRRGGAVLLGWTATTAAVLIEIMSYWSYLSGVGKVSGVLMTLLLIAVVVLTIAFVAQRSPQDGGVADAP
jgi:serine/threonine-protein kinase